MGAAQSSATPNDLDVAAAGDAAAQVVSEALVAAMMGPADYPPVERSQEKEETSEKCTVCFLAHGMGGDANDWDAWVSSLSSRFPSWVLRPLKSLIVNGSTGFLGAGLDAVAELAATEMLVFVRMELLKGCQQVMLHCIGHSMGGLVLRGALPRMLGELADEEAARLQLGHYMSLSSPHLGVQAGLGAPHHWWKNLSGLTAKVSPQLAQLAIQDQDVALAARMGQSGYLAVLADKDGPYIAALARFACRTCVTMTYGDPLIPCCSGLIQAQNPFFKPFRVAGFAGDWAFEARTGTVGVGSFETLLRSRADSVAPDVAPVDGRIEDFLDMNSEIKAQSGIGEETTAYEGKAQGGAENDTELFATSEGGSGDDNIWCTSSDGVCKFLRSILVGLNTMHWQRIPVTASLVTMNMHVFLIGKQSEQREGEHRLSRECIRCLVEVLAD